MSVTTRRNAWNSLAQVTDWFPVDADRCPGAVLKLGIEFISARDAVIRSGQFVVTRPASPDGDRLYGASRSYGTQLDILVVPGGPRRTSPAEVGCFVSSASAECERSYCRS